MNLVAKLILLSSTVTLSVSCSNSSDVPDYVIEQEKFTDILTDFQKAESIIRLGYHRYQDSVLPNDSVYYSVFRKHDITKAAFDSNYNYYANQPKIFEKMYDEVIVNLSESSAELVNDKKELPTNPVED